MSKIEWTIATWPGDLDVELVASVRRKAKQPQEVCYFLHCSDGDDVEIDRKDASLLVAAKLVHRKSSDARKNGHTEHDDRDRDTMPIVDID